MLREITLALVLPLVPPAVLQEIASETLEPGREIVRVVQVLADAEPLSGHGPALVLEPGGAGKLHVWAPTQGFRPLLRIENERGALLVESRPDWSTSCCVLEEAQAGELLLLSVTAPEPDQSGPVELHVFLTRETEASRALVAQVQHELAGLQAASGGGERSRAQIDGLVQLLLEHPGAAESVGISQALWQAAATASSIPHASAEVRALEAVLAFRLRAFPPDHPALTVARAALAHALFRSGRLARARELQQDVLAARTRDLPADHWLVADARQKLSDTLLELGEVEAANQLALEVYERLSGQLDAGDERFLGARINLSLTLRRLGRLHESRALSEGVLDTCLELRPEDDLDVQRARLNLGLVLVDLGDTDAGLELLARSYEVRSGAQARDDVARLKSGSALATALAAAGRRPEAVGLMQDLLATYSEILPASFPDLWLLRSNLAASALAERDFETARAAYDELLAEPLENDPYTHTVRGRAAELYAALGDKARADELYEAAVTALGRLLAEDSPSRVALLNNHLSFLMRCGDTQRAAERARELTELLTHAARVAALALPPRRAEAWAGETEIAIGNLLTFAQQPAALAEAGQLAAQIFALVESLRGLAFVGSRVLAAAGADEDLDRLRVSLRDASAEVVALAGRPELPEAVRRKEVVQAAFLEHLSAAGALVAQPTVANLTAALPPEAAAIGYLVYRRRVPDAPSEAWLAAHVVRPGRPLVRVDLAPRKRLHEAVATWRAAVGIGSAARGVGVELDAAGDEHAAGAALRALVLDPLSDAIGDATTLVVAVDDRLHGVPLDALPDREHGVLGDRLRIELRSTLSELLVQAPAPRDGALLALGGVDYDGQGELGSALDGAPLVVVRGAQGSFAPLPGSGEEVLAIAALYRAAFGEEKTARVLTGQEASAQRLTSLAAGARFLHVATHGFAAPETGTPTREPGTDASADPQRMRTLAFSPMVLCGLALAGANRPPDELGLVRGALTAEELAALDLSGCELAVLSACDTNVGILKNGQGAASLQKALHLAGARSTITSLWRVDDAATRRLMELFYTKLWSEGLGKADALWAAKTALRSEGLPTRDWAGWVLSGTAR